MSKENVIESLIDFGFTKGEAEAYIFLLRAGPNPARVIARKLRTNRMKAYRTLRALEKKGLVEATVERPVKFVALPLKETLDQHLEKLRENVSSLAEREKKILDEWQKIYKVEVHLEEPRFRILQGRQQVHNLLLQMSERAKNEICLVTTRNDLFRLSFAGIDDKLRSLDSKKVRTRVLTKIDQRRPEALENYLEFAEVRHIVPPTAMRIAIVDESEVLTTFAMDDSMSMTTSEDTAMWTNAVNYIKAMKAFFDGLWKNGVPVKEIISKMMTQRMLADGLRLAEKSLETSGWIVEAPGVLVGESGMEHSFDLTARYGGQLDNRPIAIDIPIEEKVLPQITSLAAKALDAKPAAQFLVATKPFDKKQVRLADLLGVRLLHANKAQKLAKKILDEATRILQE